MRRERIREQCRSVQNYDDKIGEYTRWTYEYGNDTQWTIQKEKLPEILQPTYDINDNATAVERNLWKKKIGDYVESLHALEMNFVNAYYLVRKQCTEGRTSVTNRIQFKN